MDEPSDAYVEHRDAEGKIISREAATLTFAGLAKAMGGMGIVLITGIVTGGFLFYVAVVRDGAVNAEKQQQAATDRTELKMSIDANSDALTQLTKTLEGLPTSEEVEKRAERATTEAISQSRAYTDSQVAEQKQRAAEMQADVRWIREKQDEQGRELKEGFKTIEKKITELK